MKFVHQGRKCNVHSSFYDDAGEGHDARGDDGKYQFAVYFSFKFSHWFKYSFRLRAARRWIWAASGDLWFRRVIVLEDLMSTEDGVNGSLKVFLRDLRENFT